MAGSPAVGWPRLTPVAPHVGAPVALGESPFWIGAAVDAALPLFLPGVAARHLALAERADGYYLLPQRGVEPAPTVNGAAARAPVRLGDGDVVGILPGVAYRFELAPAPAVPRAVAVAGVGPAAAAPALRYGDRDAGVFGFVRRPWRRWRDRARRARGPRVRAPGVRRGQWLGWTLGLAAAALVVAAGVLVYRAVAPGAPDVPPALTEAEARAYDALEAQAADHIERGSALLEIGVPDAALRDFGAAVAVLDSSPLRDNPWVRPRVDALEQNIAAIYRERRVAVPTRIANAAAAAAARAPRGGAAAPAAPLARESRLTVAEFAQRLEHVRSDFAARFGRPLVVTGRDHAEHVALYGPGGAADFRVRDLPPDQVQFVVASLRGAGIRVKDFSTDAVLQAQVASARAAGLFDRASTGLHLHADRFVDRRDRWTVQ